MKKTNKFMALIIAVMMVASMLSFAVTASAEESNAAFIEVSDADLDLSVKLQTLGLITNEFELSKYVTRGEMASIVAKYVGVPGASGGQAFSDVTPAHPYFGAIGALYNMGIVTGDGSGYFNPDGYVTYDQAIVYVINAIGYKPFAVREGGYPTGYHRIAIKHDMLSGLSMKRGTDKATLADIYKMLDKGMTAATVVTSYYGDGTIRYSLSDTETFLSDVHKIKQYRGIITGIPGTRLTSIATNIKQDQVEINGKLYELSGYPEFGLLGYSVDFYVSSNEPDVILHIEATARRNEVIRIDADNLLKAKTTDTRIYYRDDEDKDKEYHVDLVSNFNLIYNNQYDDMYGVLSRVLPDNGYIEVLDSDNNGLYDTLFIYTYKNVVVDSISSDGTKVRDMITGSVIDLVAGNKNTVNVYFGDSRRLTTDSIQVGDVLSIVESKLTPKILTVYISRNVVSGRIAESNSSRGYLINDEWHEAAIDYAGDASLVSGLEGTFYIDMNGDIASYARDLSVRRGNLALMTGISYKLGLAGGNITIRVYNEKGETLYLDLKDNVKVNGTRYDINDRSKAETVLGAIATDIEGGEYKVKSVYAINYVANSVGEVTELDLGKVGATGGPGKLNVVLSKETTNPFLVRNNNIIYYKDRVTGLSVRQRINPKNNWIISVPDDAELDDFEMYKKYSITHGFFYGPQGHNSVNNEYVISSYDIYSFNETDYPMADVIILRGLGGQSSGVSQRAPMDLIVDIGTAVTEDGESTVKLYMANNEYILTPMVKYCDVSGNYSEVPSTNLITGVTGELNTTVKLEKGVTVQYTLDKDDQIVAIRFISKWGRDMDGNVVVNPLFKAKSSSGSAYILDNFESPTEGCNIAMGTVDGFDFASRQIYFYAPDSTTKFFLYQDGEDVVIYDTATGEITKGSSADITPQDRFVANVDNFYTPQTFVIFR